MTARAYLRYSPRAFHDKVIVDGYPPGAFAAFNAVLCLAEEQPERGRFRSGKLLRLMLDEPEEGVHVGWGKWVPYLLDHGDLVRQDRGVLYVVGWDEWQEGDLSVADRMEAVRVARGEPAGVTNPGAKRTANWRLRKAVFERDLMACRYCGSADEPKWLVLEHVIPEPEGPSTLENLVTACRPCNKKKGNRTPEQAGMVLLPAPVMRHGDDVTNDVTPSRRRQAAAALAVASSGGGGSEGARNGEADEPYRTAEELTGWFPIQRFEANARRTLDALTDRRGIPAVVAAMREVAPGIPTQPPGPWQLVSATVKHLEPFSGPTKPEPRPPKGQVQSVDEIREALRARNA